jgi:hypothetical protein
MHRGYASYDAIRPFFGFEDFLKILRNGEDVNHARARSFLKTACSSTRPEVSLGGSFTANSKIG